MENSMAPIDSQTLIEQEGRLKQKNNRRSDELKMVPLSGEALNQLFDVLADWNHQAEHCSGLKKALAASEVEDAPDGLAAAADADYSEPAP